MAVKGGLRVDGLKGLYQGDEGTLLRLVEGVGGTAAAVETANVADADAVLIVPIGMGSHLFDGAAGMEGAVEVDDEMIANVRFLRVAVQWIMISLISLMVEGY